MVQLKSITGLELSVILVIKYSMNSSINQVSGEENTFALFMRNSRYLKEIRVKKNEMN